MGENTKETNDNMKAGARAAEASIARERHEHPDPVWEAARLLAACVEIDYANDQSATAWEAAIRKHGYQGPFGGAVMFEWWCNLRTKALAAWGEVS